MNAHPTFDAHFGTMPSPRRIRVWLKQGFDTISIAAMCGRKEHEIWNALAADEREQRL